MLEFSLDHIGWLSFLMIAFAIAFLWVSVKLSFNYFLKSFTYTSKILSVNYLMLADRILRIILSSFLITAFILVNPRFNGTLVVVLLFLTYPLLKDLFIGLTIIPKLNLLRDNLVESGDHKGTIEELRWLGLILVNKFEEKYLPYSYLFRHGFLQKENNFTSVLRFESSDIVARNAIKEAIMKKIFMLPFIAQDTLPEIRLSDSGIELRIDITDNKYEESIINAIEEIRLENTTIKAI